MTSKEVTITIDSIHHDTSPEAITSMYKGTLTEADGTLTLDYEEFFEDIAPTPVRGTSHIELGKDEVCILKEGPIQSEMRFVAGKKIPGKYHTPIMDFDITVDCQKATVEKREKEISVHLEYTLIMNGTPAATNTIIIHVS